MFAASSRLFILSDGSFPLLHHRPSTLRLARHHYLPSPFPPLSIVSRSNSHFQVQSYQQFHSQSSGSTPQENGNVPADAYLPPPSHPWPEWSELLESISTSGYIDPNSYIKDEFVPNENLSMEFVDAACSFLGFAHGRPDILGLLRKDDIQVLVNNGTPFLFKNATETEKRIRSFLQGEESSEATTLELMKYILSYASNPIFYPERNIKEATELSARNLLRDMAGFNGKREEDDQTTPTNLEPDVTIKRGEWLCHKCNFFNHGRNTLCLKCEAPLPVRQLKDNGDNGTILAMNSKGFDAEEKSAKWFNKVADLRDATDLTSVISDDDFPDIMPMRKGENRFVVSKMKDRSLNSPTYKQQQAIEQEKKTNFVPFVPFPPDYFAKKDDSQRLTSTNSSQVSVENSVKARNDIGKLQETRNAQIKRSENRPESINRDRIEPVNLNLRNRFQGSAMSEVANAATDDVKLVQETRNAQINPSGNGPERVSGDQVEPGSLNLRNGFQGSSLEGSAVKETDPFDMSEEAKAATDDVKLVQETRNAQMNTSGNGPKTVSGDEVEPGSPNVRNGFQGSSLEGSAVKETDPLDMSEKANAATDDVKLVQETRNAQINPSGNGPETASGDQVEPGSLNLRNRLQGSSLEGSAVKEPDPLDMSEEAKAERWFRRVAQIKDISELSQIPDEDFPSIMPMRKGVNRFVVSKRKTPLERRLASPEYKKNFRTVRSAPLKNDDAS